MIVKKQYYIYILLFAYSCSAFAVKPKPQRTHVRHAVKSQNARNHTAETSIDDEVNFDENDVNVKVTKKPTMLDSWRKVVTLRWGSLSRDDAWNIGGPAILVTGVLYYIFKSRPTDPGVGNQPANQPPHNPLGGNPGNRPQPGNQPQPDPFGGLTPDELQQQMQALEALEEQRLQGERDRQLQEDLRIARELQAQQQREEQQEEQELQRHEAMRQQVERNRQLQQQEQDDLRYARQLQQELEQQDQVERNGQQEQEEIEQRVRRREELQRRQEEARRQAQEEERNRQLQQQQDADELAEAIRQSLVSGNNNNSVNQNPGNQNPDIVVNPLEERDCDICAETRTVNQYTEMPCCQYSLCTQCLMEHLSVCLDKNMLAEVKCPNRNCDRLLEPADMQAITLNNLATYERYLQVGIDQYLNQEGQTKQCPHADCPFRFIPYNANRPESIVCPVCTDRYCSHCLSDHDVDRITCEQARIEREREANPDLANEADLAWIAENTKQCVRCGNAVERNAGCNHMTCKCGYEFCYVCGKAWGDLRTCPFYNHP